MRDLENDFPGGSDSSVGLVGSFGLVRALPRGSASLNYSRESRGESSGYPSVDVDTFDLSFVHRFSERQRLTLSGSWSKFVSAGDTQFVNPSFFALVGPNTCIDAGFVVIPCLIVGDDEVDSKALRASARLDWQLRKRLFTFVSVNWVDIDSANTGVRRISEYNKLLTTFGFRYLYDMEL